VSQVETVFGEYRFHNRLAARWAAFFEVLGLPYKYRPQGYTFTDLGNRQWTPDFCLPEFGSERDERVDLYLSVFERKATEWDIETAAHLWECDQKVDVALFSNGVGATGMRCWSFRQFKSPSSYSVEFAQCPFCGKIHLVQFRDEESEQVRFPSHNCLEESEFAERFDIDDAFLDFTRRDERPPLPTDSPALRIAARSAAMLQFDSAESLAMARGMRESVAVLRQNRVFARPQVTAWLFLHASGLSADENCPRFVMRPSIIHAKHLRSGNGPCLCENCQRDKVKEAAGKLAELKAPERTM
jgi:hypothetical protein